MKYAGYRGGMMNTAKHQHLNEEEIIMAVVDSADLNRPQQQHLADCNHCRSQIEALSGDLSKMAQLAEATSPVVTKPFRAPAEDRGHTGWRPFGRKLATGLAVTVACIIIGGLYLQNHLDNRSLRFAQEMHEAEQLMRQIDRLVENPLPETIMTISAEGVVENDEDFFKFLIPDENGDAAISRKVTKGMLT